MNLSSNIVQGGAVFIDGALISSASDGVTEVCNPSTGRRLFSLTNGCKKDVERAVGAARRAFDEERWGGSPPSTRKKVLGTYADLIAADAEALNALDAEEMGKPISESYGNAAAAASFMRFNAESLDKMTGDVFATDQNNLTIQRRVPRGVIAAIVPWNFPTFNAVLKIGPALAAGNCVVLKPSELSSRSALRLAQLAMQAGLPPGVLNVVPGLGTTVGKSLGLHPDVDMLAFTGSTAIGKLMLTYAGQSNMKIVMAECGGKSSQIAFADGVSLDSAADSIAQDLLINQGQLCSLGSRLLVQKSIEAEMIEKITARLSQAVIGAAMDPKVTFGPIASAAQYSRVMKYIETAATDGAQLASGGRRILPETGGYFVEPTVFRGVAPEARIAQEEIFGPVLSVIAFQDEAEAIRIANGTIFGLGATVWTSSLSTGMRLAKGIRSNVLINATAPAGEGAGYAASYEPAKQSGVGPEGGLAGIESYLRRQTVQINYG